MEEKNGISCEIKGMISYNAPTDMTLSEGGGPIEDLLGTDDVENVPDLAESASCSTYISNERNIPPILMFHAIRDEVVSIEHSRSLYAKLKLHDKEVEYYELENEGHRCPAFWGNDILDIVEEFINRNSKFVE